MCTSGGLFLDITDQDRTDLGKGIVCTRLEDLTTSARFAYYAARLLALFA